MARRKAAAPDTKGTKGTERPACGCGCGEFPKGAKSRFIPGHDARLHAAQKKAQVKA